jgi:hypothetical protein
MEKFAAMSGFGGVPSARANIGRLLAKISSEQESPGSASPTKNGNGDDAIPATPASKKKSDGRKRKTGELDVRVTISCSKTYSCDRYRCSRRR